VAWPGGKDGAGVYQRLINQIPPHDVFVSAFLGDCAILRRKLPAAVSIGIDRSRSNVERWAGTRAAGFSPAELRLYCCCGIEWLRHAFGLYAVDLVRSLKNGAVDRPPPDLATHFPAASADVAAAQSRGEGLRWFVYIDPPYLLDSRRSRRQLYEHELSEAQHVELLDTIVRLPCLVMVSHYPHPLYAERLAGWRSFTFAAQTRGGSRATEQVWCNYDEPAELHDARYVGSNKRQRERVRRRVRNWVHGLERMAPAERQAVLDAIEASWLQRPQSREPAATPA
jgi:hypothetical protein